MASGVLKGSHVVVSAESIRAGQQTTYRTQKKMTSGIIPLTFPSTRAILWDHRPTGPPAWVHFAHYRNPLVVLEEKSLRLAHHFAEQQSDSTSYRHLLIGSITCDTDGEGVTVTIERFAPLKDGSVAQEDVLPGQLLIECSLEKNSAKPSGSVEDLCDSLKTLHRYCTGKTKVDISDLVILRAYCGYHSNQQDLLFHIDFNMVVPAVKFKVTPIPTVPIMPTALSKNLAGPLSMTDLQAEPQAGYLTMDHTRKLLLVLPSDPKVYTLPLIGIWVSGVSNVHDAFVWSRCLRYHSNHTLTDRVCLPPEPFLVVLYSTLHSQPEFYDCLTSNGKQDLQFELRTCHEVIQMSKLGGPRADSPVELELVAVESGAKRDLFDAALHTCSNVLTTPAKSDLQSSSHLSGSLEDMVPRSTPAPLLTRAPTMRPSVPEVSLLFDENRYAIGKNQDSYPTNYTSKSAVKVASAPATRVPLKQVNRIANHMPAPPGGKDNTIPGQHPGSVAPPGMYPVQPYPYVAGFPPNPYGCVPMYGQPMSAFPMPPVPYAWNMYSGYSGRQRCPSVNVEPRTGAVATCQGPKTRKAIAPTGRHLDVCLSSQQRDGGEIQKHQMEPPLHLAKQYHPRAYQQPVSAASYQPHETTASHQRHASYQQQTAAAYQPQMTAALNQPQMTVASYQTQSATSYQPQMAAALHQPQTTVTSYQPQLTAATKQHMASQQQQQQQQQQHQSPIISRQSPVAAIRHADTSSTNASPLSNSTGRDSGMHSSDSADHDSLGASYDTDTGRAPADVYEILRMQDTQLRLLREQLTQLLAKQSVPPGGTAECAESRQQTCSVAINTSTLLDVSDDRHQDSDVSVKTPHVDTQQRMTSPRQCFSDTSQRGVRPPENCDESLKHDQTIASNDTLSLDDLHLTQIQDEAVSVLSDMIVDMPDYGSLTPEKIQPGSCSLCDCPGSDRCPHESVPLSQQDRHDGDDSGTDGDRDNDSGDSQTDVSLLLRNQKQFYENLITNVNKFLGQHTSVETADDTVTTVPSGSGQDRPEVDRPDGGSVRPQPHGQRTVGDRNSFVDVVENTKKQLIKMGVNVDRLNAAEKSYRLDQSSCFLEQFMLPHVSYMSMMLDNDSDLSADADALAMKYLSDEQLTELARLRQHSPKKSHRYDDGLDRMFRGRDVSTCGGGLSANHMSFASRKYMERYGLLDGNSAVGDDTVTTTPEVLNVGEFLKKLAADKSYLGSVCSHQDETPLNLTQASYASDPSPMLGGNLKWSQLSAGASPCNFRQADGGRFHGPTSTPADNCSRKPSVSSDITPNRTPEKRRPGNQYHHHHRGQPVTLLSAHRLPEDDQTPGRFFDGQCRGRDANKDFGPYLCDAQEVVRPPPQKKVERVLDIERLKELPKLM